MTVAARRSNPTMAADRNKTSIINGLWSSRAKTATPVGAALRTSRKWTRKSCLVVWGSKPMEGEMVIAANGWHFGPYRQFRQFERPTARRW
jgi:hypothetical protein